MIPFIAPDKPIRTSEEFLNDLELDEWSCEMKLDGYRVEISKDCDFVSARSRHNEIMNVDYKILEIFDAILENGSAIDGEWINHSRIKAINKILNCNIPLIECFGFHDITWCNNKYLGSLSLAERRNLPLFKELEAATINNPIDNFQVFKISMLSNDDIMSFYNQQKDIKLSEGIVIKKLKSKLIGSKSQSVKNPCWYKIKYRN